MNPKWYKYNEIPSKIGKRIFPVIVVDRNTDLFKFIIEVDL